MGTRRGPLVMVIGGCMLLVANALGASVTTMGATLPSPRAGAAAVWDDHYAYVLGGYDGDYLDDILRYDVDTNALTTLDAKLPSGRAWAAAVSTGQYVYAFGGRTATATLDEIVRFEPATGEVVVLDKHLPSGRWAASAAWDPGGLPPNFGGPAAYVAGGCLDVACDEPTGEIVSWEPRVDSVRVRDASLPTARWGTAAGWSCCDKNGILVFGGRDGAGDLDDVLFYDAAAETVTAKEASLPTPRSQLAGVWSGGTVFYLFGGCTGDPCSAWSDEILYYAPREADRMISQGYAPIPTGRSGAAVAWATSRCACMFVFGGEGPGLIDEIVRFDPDRTPPRTTAALAGTEGLNGWFLSEVDVELSATDAGSGVATTMVSIEGGPFAAYGGPFTLAGDGDHAVRFFSEDRAGNVEQTQTVAIRIDATPPEVALVRPVAGNAYVRNVEDPLSDPLPYTLVVDGLRIDAVAADATSGVAFVEFLIDDASRAMAGAPPYQFFWLAGDEALGEHAVAVRATDFAGNEAVGAALTVTTLPTGPTGVQRSLP